jgi:spectinomycin phosphotransferase
MSSRTDVATGRIVEYVRRVYGLDARHVVRLVDGDTEAAVYRIDSDQGSHFLKLRRHQPENAPSLARLLADSGITQVLAPLSTRDGQLSSRIGDLSATLYPFIEGENAFRTPLNEGQWTAFGTVVRAVHDMKLPSSVRETMRRETYSDVWRRKVCGYLSAVPAEGPNDGVARELVRLLASKRTVITTVMEHAEQLASSLQRKALSMVPCHGDLHAGNLLIESAGSLMIVDWDDPVLAPKERDLMFVGAGVGGVWNRSEEAAAFYRGYGPTSVDAEALAYYRSERVIEDVAVYCDQLLLEGGDEGAERKRSLRRLADQFRPNDVFEIAERTFATL